MKPMHVATGCKLLV